VLALSISAIVVGTWLWLSHDFLTPGAFWANILWASINLGLAGSVVRFTLSRKHRRREYRFPIPLPAFITNAEGKKVFGLVEDISADGCRFMSESPVDATDRVTGEIFLPSGRMPFLAHISRHYQPLFPKQTEHDSADQAEQRPSRRKREYGLMFSWKSANDAVQLENFLYGSDLQWRILDMHEGFTTPAAWIVSQFTRHEKTVASGISTVEWLPVIYHLAGNTDQQDRLGVLSRNDWARQPASLIMFESVTPRSSLELYIFGRMPQDRVHGELAEIQKLHTTSADIYVGKILLPHRGPNNDEFSR
jgi:cellulose synthase (UDP-forming)